MKNLVGSHPREHDGLDQTVATEMEVYRDQEHLGGKPTRFGDGLNERAREIGASRMALKLLA